MEEPRYELCEIVRRLLEEGLFNSHGRFWAEAVGPKGRYSAGASPAWSQPELGLDIFPGRTKRQIVKALDSLIQKLLEDGWEPVEAVGNDWWSHRFRRRLDG